jgi:hypothetical protein
MRRTEAQKRAFISQDLYHELRCLLGATTVWRAFQAENAGFSVVVAMDSAFVHARNLFNFLADSTTHDSCVTQFGPSTPYDSPVYTMWSEPLHRHVLHIADARISPTNTRGGEHLNQQVESFTREALRLWELFEHDPAASKFHLELNTARLLAIDCARHDASGRITALF